MARKRMIDPGIWQSEDFGKLSNLAKIVFIGLFSLADDEGRGRANPAFLKSSLFPYEESLRSADIEKTLSEISSNMSVIFYSCDENQYYELCSWEKFQTINRPSKSQIPQYIEGDSSIIQRTFNEHSMNTHGTLTPNRKEKNRREENRKEEKESTTFSTQILEVYSRECTSLPQVKVINDSRRRAIDKFKKTFSIEQFTEICQKANESSFLTGKNDRGWKADLDFLLRIDKATNILEGKYTDKEKPPNEAKQDNWAEFMKTMQERGET